MELSCLEIGVVDAGDLQFAACGRTDLFRDPHNLVVIEIEPRDRVIGLRILRLLFDGDRIARRVEFNDAEALRIPDIVSENRRPRLPFRCLPQKSAEIGAVKDVVPQHQRDGIRPDELLPDQERLRQSFRFRLHGVAEEDPEPGSVAQKPLKRGLILRRGDHKDLPDSRQHQRADRIIDHRLVINSEELFGNSFCDRMQSGSRSAGQHDSLHAFPPVPRRSIL